MSSFIKKLEEFPPLLCRLLAVRYPAGRRGWPIPLTDAEIAERGELTPLDVRRLSLMLNWERVSIGRLRRFLKGCRVNLENWHALRRIKRMSDRGRFNYLRRSPEWPRFKVMLDMLKSDARFSDQSAAGR